MKKVLIIRLSSLGDIILTFPVIRNIKLNFPQSTIYYLTKKQFKEVLLSNPDVDKVIVFDGLLKTIKILRDENFDYIFDLHANLRSFLMINFLKASKKIKYNKDSLLRYLLITFKYISPRLEKHVVDKYLEVLKKVGLNIFTTEVSIKNLKNIPKNSQNKEFKKIVIFQTAFLGDLLLTLPMIYKIRQCYPKSFMAIVIRKENLNVVEGLKEIDLIILDEKTIYKYKSFFKILNTVRREKFDVAIIPHRSLRTALLAFFSKIPLRIGFDIKPISFFYNVKVPFKWSLHETERNIMLIDSITKDKEINFPKLINKNSLNYNFDKPTIVINPSSIWETKRWPAYKFAKLIEIIHKKYLVKPIIIGTQKENKQVEEIEKYLSNKDIFINLCGKTSVEELINIIRNADLLITNDSGPMHIAVACNTNVVAIFGPTTKELGFFPYSKNSIVVEEILKCRPCRLHGSKRCPHKHFLCMKLVRIESVLNSIEKILKYKL